MSGWQDSNLRPPAPKAGAMTGLRYTPNYNKFVFISILSSIVINDADSTCDLPDCKRRDTMTGLRYTPSYNEFVLFQFRAIVFNSFEAAKIERFFRSAIKFNKKVEILYNLLLLKLVKKCTTKPNFLLGFSYLKLLSKMPFTVRGGLTPFSC